MRALLGVSSRDALAGFVEENFTKIFEQKEIPSDLGAVLKRIVADPKLPPVSAPIERLLAIQDGLESYYLSYGGKGVSFPLQAEIKVQIAAEMRTAMFRPMAGAVPYLSDLGKSIGANKALLYAAQAKEVVKRRIRCIADGVRDAIQLIGNPL
jgi:hypothetical protein